MLASGVAENGGNKPGKDRFKAYLYSHLKKYAICLWAGEIVLLSEIAL